MQPTKEETRDIPVMPENEQCQGPKHSCRVADFPRIRFPRETQRRYTPWLVVRYANGDDGSRPLTLGSAYWESPDVWVEGPLGKDQPVPGEVNTLFARVSNWGLQDATGVTIIFYAAFPTLAVSTPSLIGTGYANIQSGDTAVIECPTKWVPDSANGGHQCLIVEAFVPAFDDLTSPMDPWDDRHVGQKNEQLVILGPGEFFRTTVQAANAMSIGQALTFEVQPLRAAIAQTTPAVGAKLVPVKTVASALALPLTFRLDNSPALFMAPSAVFARRLLSQTLQDVVGTSKHCSVSAQITHTAHFEPWEARMIEITGQVPRDARPGQTFSVRIVQRAGLMITGGYTVNIVVAGSRTSRKEVRELSKAERRGSGDL